MKAILTAVTLVVSMAGCSSSDFDIVPVSGVVTLDDQPLAGAFLTFNPRATGDNLRAGPDSYGKTDENGRFELETIDRDRGAVVATHRVRIRTYREEEGPGGEVIVVSKELLPERYHVKSELTFQVPKGGTDSADFALTTE